LKKREKKMASAMKATLKIPEFSGNADEYSMWEERFESAMGVLGIEGALVASTDMPTNQTTGAAINKNTTNAREKKQLKAYQDNQMVMHHLKMSMKTQALMNNIASVKTRAWPGGKASDVIKALKE
jgi:hypothetical protein